MSDKLQLAICGPSSIALRLPPVEQITLPDFDALKNHVHNHAKSRSFIILCLDLNDPNSKKDLEDLRKEAHVFAICIHVKRGCNFTFNAGKVFPVAKQFITQRITSCVIQFFENESKRLLKDNRIFEANNFQKKANTIKDQRRSTNTTIPAIHVLINGLNVTEDELSRFQELVINLCNDLRDHYEPTVHTLGDYFSSDENPDLYGDDDDDKKQYDLIEKISKIRLHLIRKDTRYLPSFSQSVFQREPNNSDTHDHYIKFIFVESQPVIEQTELNLSNERGCTLQSTNITPELLDEIRNDIRFVTALDRANVTLPQRTMCIEEILKRQAAADSNNPVEVSAAYHMIQQAPNGGAGEERNNMIQM